MAYDVPSSLETLRQAILCGRFRVPSWLTTSTAWLLLSQFAKVFHLAQRIRSYRSEYSTFLFSQYLLIQWIFSIARNRESGARYREDLQSWSDWVAEKSSSVILGLGRPCYIYPSVAGPLEHASSNNRISFTFPPDKQSQFGVRVSLIQA